jgi:hypothetical protein
VDHVRSIVSWIITSALTLGVASGVVLVDRKPPAPTSYVASETTVPHHAVTPRTVHRRAALTPRFTASTLNVKRIVRKKVTRTQATTTTVAPTTTLPPTTTTVAPTTTTTVLTVVNVTTTTVHHGGSDDGGGGGGGTTSTTIDN